MQYAKPHLNFEQQLDKLIGRGLTVSNRAVAAGILEKISYYRLSAYFLPFLDQKDIFRIGVTFDQILELYEFDRQLRFIYFESVEGIEIAIRTALTYYLSLAQGPFGYVNPDHYMRGFKSEHEKWLVNVAEELEHSISNRE